MLQPFPEGKPRKSRNDFWFQVVLVLILVGFGVWGVIWVRKTVWDGQESDRRATCASRLSQIGKALVIYSNENNGQLPPDFATLMRDQPVVMDVFVCPSSRGKSAKWSDDIQFRRTALSNPRHNSFIYCGEGLAFENYKIDSEIVLAFERPSNHEVGLNILLGDGHVEFVSASSENVQKMFKDAESGVRPVRLKP